MPYHIETSRFSFIQFSEVDTVGNCNFADMEMCLPAYADDDVWFQFVVAADTQAEAEDLCAGEVDIALGLVQQCSDGFLLPFAQSPVRYRLSPTRVGYVWPHGIPAFQAYIDVGECFHIKIMVGAQSFCTNCFQRIGDDCHTSVLEYSNEDNAFGYFYCGGGDFDSGGGRGDGACEPLEIPFVHQSTMTIPWTAYLMDRYGATPSVEVWVRDENGDLIKPGVVVKMDDYPPTQISIDFGGDASGVVKIM